MDVKIPSHGNSQEGCRPRRRGTQIVWLIVAAHLVAPWALLCAEIMEREPEPAVQPMFVRAVTTTSWALTYSQVALLALWFVLGRSRWRLLVAPISLCCLDIEVVVRIWLERQSKFTFSRYDPLTLWSELSANFWRFATEGLTWAAPLIAAFLLVRLTGRRVVLSCGLDPRIRPFQFRLMTLFWVTAAVATAIPLFRFLRHSLPFSEMYVLSKFYPGTLAAVTLVAALGRQQLWWRAGVAVAALVWMPLVSTLLAWRGDGEYILIYVVVATIQIVTLYFFRYVGYRIAPWPNAPPSCPM